MDKVMPINLMIRVSEMNKLFEKQIRKTASRNIENLNNLISIK